MASVLSAKHIGPLIINGMAKVDPSMVRKCWNKKCMVSQVREGLFRKNKFNPTSDASRCYDCNRGSHIYAQEGLVHDVLD